LSEEKLKQKIEELMKLPEAERQRILKEREKDLLGKVDRLSKDTVQQTVTPLQRVIRDQKLLKEERD
jgi:hypothetical protein